MLCIYTYTYVYVCLHRRMHTHAYGSLVALEILVLMHKNTIRSEPHLCAL